MAVLPQTLYDRAIMNPADLQRRIELGEDSFLELKEVRVTGSRVTAPHRDGLANELAAFANTRGGLCILGVEDKTRKLLGIPREHLDAVEGFVETICNDSIDPPLHCHIRKEILSTGSDGEAAVLCIDVPKSLFVHQSPGGYFCRSGSSCRQMRPEFLARMFQQRSQTRLIRFDEQVISSAYVDDLDPVLLDRFRTVRSDQDLGRFLHKMAMTRKDEDETSKPTVAGVLLASKDPRRWLPNAFIQAVAYRGTEPRPASPTDVYQIDAADMTGPLDKQIIDACAFVRKNMRVEATKYMGRCDTPQYCLTSVFEAIVNAVAHRDYSMYGSKVRLRLFADRLEIYCPGPLVNTMDVESLPLRQAVRNEAVVSLLARLPIPDELEWLPTTRKNYMDRRGEGVAFLLRESEQLSGKVPVYRMLDESELMLTIFAASAATSPGGQAYRL